MDLVNLESLPPDDPKEESNDEQKEDISDANECVNAEAKPDTTLDATPDATKEEIVSDERLFYLFLFSYIELDDNCGLIFISDRNKHSYEKSMIYISKKKTILSSYLFCAH